MSDKWMTIDSAPKDGTSILVAATGFDANIGVVAWDDTWCDGWWMCDDGKQAMELPLRGPEPTHWMPLPPAPKDASHD